MVQMRAVLIKNEVGPAENLYLGETTRPSPGQGDVLVKVKAFGLNRSDISQRNGDNDPPPGASQILGIEFAGIVVELGEDATGWKQGDEVLGLASGGAYAEYIVVRQTHIVKKPEQLSWAEAASLPECFMTAIQALILVGEFKKGEDVMVHAAASGVGIAAIQLARVYGAKTVTATASTSEKLNWILSIPNGATHAVNYKTQDFSEEVMKTTGGKGVDVIVDFVGQSHFSKNIGSLAKDGRMTLLSNLSGAIVPSVNLKPILHRRLRIQGSTLRSRSPEYQADLIAKFRDEVLGSITGGAGDGLVRTYIHKVYPWAEIVEAHREMEANNNIGKIIVEVV
ncbi:quinone oxidoreductase [Amylocystis lapponica]|nr:quinone oxidoreductase [Amylocystis lapponica]